MNILKKIFLLLAISLMTKGVFAIDITLNPGSPPFLFPETNQNVRLVTYVPQKRSICCQIHSIANQGAVTLGDYNINSFIDNFVLRNRGGDVPILSMQVGGISEGRKCFYYEDPEVDFVAIRFNLLSENNQNYDNTYGHCTDTTLYGGFNTSVSHFNFIEINNLLKSSSRGNGVLSGKIIATDSISDTVIINQAFTLNPESRVDIDVHSISGPGRFGQVLIYHDGPPGSLQAVSSQYRVISQNPLNFEPVSQQTFESRSGNY